MNEEKIPFFSYNSDTQKFWILGKIADTKEEVDKCICIIMKENQQLKEQLQQRDNIINKLVEIKYNFQNENPLIIFENNDLLKFMNDLQDIFNLKIRSDK